MSNRDALRQIAFYAGMILIVLALYVLSFGPAQWLFFQTTSNLVRRVIAVVYYPLQMAAESGIDGGFLIWYALLWMSN